MQFEWDTAKNAANLRKHGISFEEAIKIFDDPDYRSEQDQIQNGEQRWQSFGHIGPVLLVMVAHLWTDSDGAEIVRVISARYATPKERRNYDRENR